MAQSKTVILEREGIAEQIRAAIAESEIPYTKMFAVIYREHPTVAIRSQKILNKEIKAA